MMPLRSNISFHAIAHKARSEKGHFFHYQRACQEAVEPAVEQFVAYAPCHSEITQWPEGWKQWFRAAPIGKGKKLFWQDCKRLFRAPSETKNRIFFLESLDRRPMRYFSWAALLYAKRSDHFFCLIRSDLTTVSPKERRGIRFFCKMLRFVFRSRFLMLTDSELIADYYEKWLGERPKVLPIPHTLQGKRNRSVKKERLVCFWPGSPRYEKGLEQIARLVELNDPAAEKIELHLSEEADISVVTNRLALHRHSASLTQEEYFRALEQSDIVLLPYETPDYQRRTSGIFVEAVVAGKMPCVSEGTWMAHELRRFHLEELILDWDHPQLFKEISLRASDSDLLEKLRKMQICYLHYHNSENFAKEFQALIESSLLQW